MTSSTLLNADLVRTPWNTFLAQRNHCPPTERSLEQNQDFCTQKEMASRWCKRLFIMQLLHTTFSEILANSPSPKWLTLPFSFKKNAVFFLYLNKLV